MTILCIETSTNCCSAAIAINGEAKAIRANLTGANHASELPLFVEELMNEARANSWTINAVALSQGPGSYTGLRIGASLAKGLCYGLNIPLIPVDTLQILCVAALAQQLPQRAVLCPMLDARRMEVYTSLYTCECARMREIEAKIIDEHAFEAELTEQTICFFGNGAVNIFLIDVPNYECCCTLLKRHCAHNTSYTRRSAGYKHSFVIKLSHNTLFSHSQ